MKTTPKPSATKKSSGELCGPLVGAGAVVADAVAEVAETADVAVADTEDMAIVMVDDIVVDGNVTA